MDACRDQYLVALPSDLLSDREMYLALLVVRNHRLWLDVQTLELINGSSIAAG